MERFVADIDLTFFSTFVFYEEQVITQSNHNLQHILFNFQQSEGIGLTANKIQDSTKDMPHSSRLHQSRETIGNFQWRFFIFFGLDSIGTMKLDKLIICYGWHSQDLKEMIAADSTFPVQFLHTVDTRVQKWLQACKKVKSRDLVEDSYLEFTSLN